MPHRPNKKPRESRVTGKAAVAPGADAQRDQMAQQRRRDFQTKAILGKFQGRKSI
jgi:hypothetical protein